MKINWGKAWYALQDGDHLPRKVKKVLLGKRMKKSKLRKLLTTVQVIPGTSRRHDTILPGEFCPKCGCEIMTNTGNMAEYPDHYEKFYCARCRFLVANIDNSPFIHALSCKENGYDCRI